MQGACSLGLGEVPQKAVLAELTAKREEIASTFRGAIAMGMSPEKLEA